MSKGRAATVRIVKLAAGDTAAGPIREIVKTRVSPAGYVEVGRFNSTRRPENVYIVKQSRATGELWCSCPGWRFSRTAPKTCVHIKAANDPAIAERLRLAQIERAQAVRLGVLRDILRAAWTRQFPSSVWIPTDPFLERVLSDLDASGLFVFAPSAPTTKPTIQTLTRLFTLED